MGNDFSFENGRMLKTGSNVTPFDMADMVMECVEDKPEEIQSVIVIVKRRTERGDVFEMGYTTDSVDGVLGKLEVAKDIAKDRFFGGAVDE